MSNQFKLFKWFFEQMKISFIRYKWVYIVSWGAFVVVIAMAVIRDHM